MSQVRSTHACLAIGVVCDDELIPVARAFACDMIDDDI
jgi:hypothetical protein